MCAIVAFAVKQKMRTNLTHQLEGKYMSDPQCSYFAKFWELVCHQIFKKVGLTWQIFHKIFTSFCKNYTVALKNTPKYNTLGESRIVKIIPLRLAHPYIPLLYETASVVRRQIQIGFKPSWAQHKLAFLAMLFSYRLIDKFRFSNSVSNMLHKSTLIFWETIFHKIWRNCESQPLKMALQRNVKMDNILCFS